MTRSILLLWPLILAVVLLDGCKRVEAETKSNPQASEAIRARFVMEVFTDPETGCQYLGVYQSAVTPRMDRNGKQICMEVK